MALDPKLRDVLDFLPCEPCLERPSPDQEVLCSICHRLNRTVALKCQVSLVAPETTAPSAAELEAAREEARLKQQEFETLRAQQEADEDAVSRLQAERDELLAKQRELEDRLAALESQSHGGQITFVEEGPQDVDTIVEFSRVDLGGTRPAPTEDEDIMEFESMGGSGSAFAEPEASAWEDTSWEESAWEEPRSEDATWEEGSSWEETEPHPADGTETVAWDEGDEAVTSEETLPYGEEEEAPWETVDEATDWSGSHAEAEGRAHAETEEEALEDLDERTRADLSELEAQLEELEQELSKKRTETDEDEDEA